MRRTVTTIILLGFMSLLFASDVNVFSEVSAVPNTNRVVITWVTKSETGVQRFVIARSNDDKTYISLKRISAKGPGTEYEYVDVNVMFNDFSALFYKVKALDAGGQVVDETSMIVHPNISGIFRTWGAIKALFR